MSTDSPRPFDDQRDTGGRLIGRRMFRVNPEFSQVFPVVTADDDGHIVVTDAFRCQGLKDLPYVVIDIANACVVTVHHAACVVQFAHLAGHARIAGIGAIVVHVHFAGCVGADRLLILLDNVGGQPRRQGSRAKGFPKLSGSR